MAELVTDISPAAQQPDDRRRPRVMAFELQIGGHHPSYIRNFAQQWAARLVPAEIDFVVTQQFFDLHAEVVDLVKQLNPECIRIHSLTDTENKSVDPGMFREFNGWKLFCDYARRLNADRGLLMYSDHFQLPMLLGQSAPCPVSCIYFRPTFHYGQLANYQPSLTQRLAAWRKKTMLGRLLKLKKMDVLFCLDSLAVDYLHRHFSTKARIRQMPDSFARHPISADQIVALRNDLGIQSDRCICMLLGILDLRKGPLQLLDAARNLPDDAQRKLCLLLVGKVDESISEEVARQVGLLQQQTRVQVVFRDAYISDTEVQKYYEVADVALTTYQRHMGMSSALIRAALANIPVLSSSYGLMGELVQRHRLGLTVDTTSTTEFSDGLEQVLTGKPESLFDPDSALAFANAHSPAALADTLAQWIAP